MPQGSRVLLVLLALLAHGVVTAVVGRPGALHQPGGHDADVLEVIEELLFLHVVVLQLLVHYPGTTLCSIAVLSSRGAVNAISSAS